jgi:hypothetical protein
MARDRDREGESPEKGRTKADAASADKRGRGRSNNDTTPKRPARPYDAWALIEKILQWDKIRTIMIYGPPGTGKTYAALNGGRRDVEVLMVTITEETSAAELRGHWIFKGAEATFHMGPFVRAMVSGARLVINEISNASADVLDLLMSILENWATAMLTLPSGETVRPAPGFHVIATDNKSPDQLPEALRDRFQAVVEVLDPHPGALAALRPAFRRLAEKALNLPEDRRISGRAWANLELLVDDFGLELACLITFGPERGTMFYDALRLALDFGDDLLRDVGRHDDSADDSPDDSDDDSDDDSGAPAA